MEVLKTWVVQGVNGLRAVASSLELSSLISIRNCKLLVVWMNVKKQGQYGF